MMILTPNFKTSAPLNVIFLLESYLPPHARKAVITLDAVLVSLKESCKRHKMANISLLKNFSTLPNFVSLKPVLQVF